MTTLGCGCKICKAGLGNSTNELILNGESPKSVLNTLQHNGLKASENLLKKHLSAYSIPYPERAKNEIVSCEPIQVDLNKIDFSEYNFDQHDIESIIGYLQKINLKIYLNQSKITLQAQQDILEGISIDMPKEILQNQAIAFQILEKSTGLAIHVNQQEAVKVVEAMGLTVQNRTYLLPLSDAQNQSECQTN